VNAVLKKLIPLFSTSFIAGVILAILGPFGTSQMPFAGRLIYWVGLCLAGGFGVGLVDLGLKGRRWKPSHWLETLLQSFGATALVCFFMFVIFPPANLYSVLISIFYIWVIFKEVAPLTGVKTHRSWWVAERGVETVKRKKDKTIILLKNDSRVPVSRSGQKAVKDAGWI